MKLINTDGMAIIGPGSEWFWTAVRGLVLAITFIAIYRQLRLQASAGAIEQMESLQRDWISERMSRSRLRVQLALHGGVDPATLPGQAAGDIANFWERLGYLVRAGHVDRDLVYGYMGNLIRLWWACLAPHVQLSRDRYGDSAIGEEFEWLAGVVAEMDVKAGSTLRYDQAYLAGILPQLIENNADAVRVDEELRAVIVRPMSTGTLTPEVSP